MSERQRPTPETVWGRKRWTESRRDSQGIAKSWVFERESSVVGNENDRLSLMGKPVAVLSRRTGNRPPLPSGKERIDLHVEVEAELVWMRTQANRVDLLFPLVPDPRADYVLREDVAAQKELVVLLQ